MLTFTTGDLFETPADIRINTVNCVGIMGAGLALAFKQRYPVMFEEYRRACAQNLVQPGKPHVWSNPNAPETIINVPTKRHWRQPSRYDDVELSLVWLRDYLVDKGEVRIALPALGAGLGGLDWERVKELIIKHLSDLPAKIMVFSPIDSRVTGKSSSSGKGQNTEKADESRKQDVAATPKLAEVAVLVDDEAPVGNPKKKRKARTKKSGASSQLPLFPRDQE